MVVIWTENYEINLEPGCHYVTRQTDGLGVLHIPSSSSQLFESFEAELNNKGFSTADTVIEKYIKMMGRRGKPNADTVIEKYIKMIAEEARHDKI